MSPMIRDFYLEIQEELGVLRSHFEICEGAGNKEVLDWARFFLQWSKRAGRDGEDWGKTTLKAAEKIAKTLEKPPAGTNGFGILQEAMREAAAHLSQRLRAVEIKPVAIVRATSDGFFDDLEAPRARHAG